MEVGWKKLHSDGLCNL